MDNTISRIAPLLQTKLRDTCICLAGDGCYYMTGSIGEDIWDHNDGIPLWKSEDLINWTDLGLVWTFEKDATWQKAWRTHHEKPIRSIWAPEIHYIRGNFFLTYSTPPGGTGILKSTTGRPEGPYVNALREDKPLTDGIDASLFEDEDGQVYFLYGGGMIARMDDAMSALAEEPRRLLCDRKDPDPNRHASRGYKGMDEIGFEGAFLFKFQKKYFLSCGDFWYGRYSSIVAVSDSLYGPYRNRHEAVTCGGHNNYFQDKDGQWWSTFFGNDPSAPFREKPAIVKVAIDMEQERIYPFD